MKTLKAKKTTMSFTREELEILNAALNNYGLEMMNQSKTWGNYEEVTKRGGPDVWHGRANIANHLWSRTYQAEIRMDDQALNK